MPAPINYDKWNNLEDDDDDLSALPQRDCGTQECVESTMARDYDAFAKSHRGLFSKGSLQHVAIHAFARIVNDDQQSEEALRASASLLRPEASAYLWTYAIERQHERNTVAMRAAARQLVLLRLVTEFHGAHMPGRNACEAITPVFHRMRWQGSDDGPYSEAKASFGRHLNACVAEIEQRAAAAVFERDARAMSSAEKSRSDETSSRINASGSSDCCGGGEDSAPHDVESSSRERYASIAASVVAGLLGSSCCLIQLVLNTMAVGCAGFNKVLGGRARPVLRVLTACWLMCLWAFALRKRRPVVSSALLPTLVCLCLTLLPEALLLGGGRAMAPSLDGSERQLDLAVDGMGCEACESHVRSVIERSAGVVDSQVDFTAGSARLLVSQRWGYDHAALVAKLARDGYEIKEVVEAKAEPADAAEPADVALAGAAPPAAGGAAAGAAPKAEL